MPVTRRKRATSPEQPENTNTAAQTPEQAAGSPAEASAAELSTTEKAASSEKSSPVDPVAESSPTEKPEMTASSHAADAESSPVAAQETSIDVPETPAQETRTTAHFEVKEPSEPEPNRQEPAPAHHRAEAPAHARRSVAARAAAENGPYQPLLPSGSSNGDRPERQDYSPSSIEGGRRTARGELFRRPPQPPTPPYVPPPSQPAQAPQLQAPTHEISLPLGNLLHLAYNPGYTGSEEARSVLLHQLEDESKAGGRARCWNCGSLAIVYDRWNTRSKTFGEIGIAFCEICGVWSVM
ncbi:MAG TPA: hypothetical protein VL485_11780 [Ktedonobacteraceae bacterium]|jgi:hypothetical protein|nr:hypothetical protein [Ktedonobacteraceae bacterium]